MTDIVQRLRTVPLYEGHGEESSLPEQAADAIEALQARVKELEASAAGWEASAEMEAKAHWAARDRIRALEEALMPLADEAEAWDAYNDDEPLVESFRDYSGSINVRSLRRARDVLKGEGQ